MGDVKVVVGCCGFPVRRALYAQRLAGVELQQTFYQPPAPATARRWREEAPAGFTFCLKAWQLVTHPATSPTYRRLRAPLPPTEAAGCGYLRPSDAVRRGWEATVVVAREVGARCILLQTPASFGPGAEHVANLRAMVPELRRAGFPLAWEPRGAWEPALVAALCAELGLIPAGDPLGPFAPALTGPVRYWRLHGRTGFRYRHTDADLEELRALLERGTAPETVYCFFNNRWMWEDALRFARLLAGDGAELLAGGGARDPGSDSAPA